MGQPNMTTAPENSSPEATSGPESQPAYVKFLEPTPSGFEPEYDYLATVRAISEARGLDTATGVILDWMTQIEGWNNEASETKWLPHCRACVIDSTGPADCLTDIPRYQSPPEKDRVDWLYLEIREIRQTMKIKAQRRTCVLVAGTHDPLVLQVLGTALDLDPGFFLRHSNGISRTNISDLESASLSKECFDCIVPLRKGDGDDLGHAHMDEHMATAETFDSLHIQGQSEVRYGQGESRHSCISYCQVSTYGCKSFLFDTKRYSASDH
jgi:hypothetical protein